jgi:hypothetical protein
LGNHCIVNAASGCHSLPATLLGSRSSSPWSARPFFYRTFYRTCLTGFNHYPLLNPSSNPLGAVLLYPCPERERRGRASSLSPLRARCAIAHGRHSIEGRPQPPRSRSRCHAVAERISNSQIPIVFGDAKEWRNSGKSLAGQRSIATSTLPDCWEGCREALRRRIHDDKGSSPARRTVQTTINFHQKGFWLVPVGSTILRSEPERVLSEGWCPPERPSRRRTLIAQVSSILRTIWARARGLYGLGK